MKKTTLAVMLLGLAAAPAGAERPMLRGREAPHATDLLRAEKLAEQAERRLRLPAPRSAGWKKGGHGWDARGEAPPRSSERVTINLGSSRRRAGTP
jgi:hypothetical protein